MQCKYYVLWIENWTKDSPPKVVWRSCCFTMIFCSTTFGQTLSSYSHNSSRWLPLAPLLDCSFIDMKKLDWVIWLLSLSQMWFHVIWALSNFVSQDGCDSIWRWCCNYLVNVYRNKGIVHLLNLLTGAYLRSNNLVDSISLIPCTNV